MDADSLAQVLPDLRGDSKRKYSFLFLISKIGCRHLDVQLLRISQRDRLFVGPFNAEKVQGCGECEYQWPCCALLRFKTHVGGQDASLMQRLRILCSIGHAGERIGSLM